MGEESGRRMNETEREEGEREEEMREGERWRGNGERVKEV